MAVASDRVEFIRPSPTVMSFVASCSAPDADGSVCACCPQIHYLRSPEEGAAWKETNALGHVLTLDQAWDLALTFVNTKLLPAPITIQNLPIR
jgi:hypothetical protein